MAMLSFFVSMDSVNECSKSFKSVNCIIFFVISYIVLFNSAVSGNIDTNVRYSPWISTESV